MSYPPPPGVGASSKAAASPSSSSVTNQQQPAHASLPPRPPPPAGPPPSFTSTTYSSPVPSLTTGAPGTASYDATPGVGVGVGVGAAPGSSGFPSYRPGQAGGATPGWTKHAASVSAAPVGYSSAPTAYGGTTAHQAPYQAGHTQSYYGAAAQGPYTSTSPPQIRNPFPLPGQEQHAGVGRGRGPNRYHDPGVDPEMEAQIAQWQSAYVSKDASDQTNSRTGARWSSRSGHGTEGPATASGANAGPVGGRADAAGSSATGGPTSSTAETDSGAATTAKGADGKQKTVTVQRSGGGQNWTDQTLLEWDPAHFRLFVGNLAGEVTDESLLKAFARYPSVQKARVIRDKRTTKSKGYGFVSFGDGDEYFQAAKEMQGKYIGSHPVLLRRSTTEIRPFVHGDKKHNKHAKGGKAGAHGAAGGPGVGPGAKTGAGVQKKSNKTKGGLRVLG